MSLFVLVLDPLPALDWCGDKRAGGPTLTNRPIWVPRVPDTFKASGFPTVILPAKWLFAARPFMSGRPGVRFSRGVQSLGAPNSSDKGQQKGRIPPIKGIIQVPK